MGLNFPDLKCLRLQVWIFHTKGRQLGYSVRSSLHSNRSRAKSFFRTLAVRKLDRNHENRQGGYSESRSGKSSSIGNAFYAGRLDLDLELD